jgi:WYL domain
LRADRFLSAEPMQERDAPPQLPHIPLESWTGGVKKDFGKSLKLRVLVSERGAKRFELVSLLGRIEFVPGRYAVVEAEIPHSEIDFYASGLLIAGTDVRVESSPELIRAMRERALEVARLYD